MDGVLQQVAGGRFMNGTMANTTSESESSYSGNYDGDNSNSTASA